MEGIRDEREGYGNHNNLNAQPHNNSLKYNSFEQREDSGFGSMGYPSLDRQLSCGSFSSIDECQNPTAKQNNGNQHANRSNSVLSTDLANSLSHLSIGSKSSSIKCGERCDSGLEEERDSGFERSYLHTYSNLHWVSAEFTPTQIVEIFAGDEDGDNHLHLSIIHNLPELTMQIIGLAPSSDWLNYSNNLQQTPLHLAVLTRQVSVVRRLVCAGASVDIRDQVGNTPLHSACGLGFEDIVQELLSPVRAEETYQNKYEIAYQRIPQDMEIRNYEGLACLHLGAMGGHLNIMRLLLGAGADVNAAEGKSGRTVLHLACDWGNCRMADFLLSHRDTDIDAKTYSGLTPILLAWGRQFTDLAQMLFSRGAVVEDDGVEDVELSDEEMSNESDGSPTPRQIQGFPVENIHQQRK